jgi:cobalt transport protein ATP-binding subunit
MSAALALPPYTDSPLGRLDARWRLAALVAAGLTVPALRTLPTAASALVGAVILAATARLPRNWAAARLGSLLLVLVPFALWLPFAGAPPGWRLGPVWLSAPGTRSAVLLLLKGLSLGLIILTGLVAAPLPTNLKAARALHVPGPLVQLFVLTLRYAFVLSAELGRLRTALRVRGYRNRANWHSYRTVGHVAGNLLVRGYERAERVGQAMRCRGFDGQYRSLADFRTRPTDVAAFVLIVGAACALLWADASGRFDTPREDALLPNPRLPAMTEPAIRVDGLTYRYPGGAPALDGVRFEAAVGERVGLVGPNGAGKTTLFLCLSGVLRGRGTVLLAGLDPSDPTQRRQLPARVGIIFQDSDDQVFNATVFDDVAFGPLNLGLPADEVRARVKEALAAVALSGLESRVPFHLSGGERRRVALAGVLAMRPEILLLDEPSLHLDPRGRRELIRLINQLPGTQVVAAHDLELILETCSRTLVIDGGRVVADGPARELLANAALMEAHGLEVPYSLRKSV